MVTYYGMSDKLPNLSYYDSTGQAYGFSKPYSEDRSRMIDEEVSRIINEQYERAKELLRTYAKEHNTLADVLYNREVIFTEDVEHIFGKRKWVSRTDEILKAQQEAEKQQAAAHAKSGSGVSDGKSDVMDVTAVDVTPPPSMPPIPEKDRTEEDKSTNESSK